MTQTGNKDRHIQLWLVPAAGDARRALVADVAVDVRTPRVPAYSVPAELADRIRPGTFVRVPYGRRGRLVNGLCVGVALREWSTTLQPIADVAQSVDWLSPRLVDLARWLADYYVCSPWAALTTIVPAVSRRPKTRRVEYLALAAPSADLPTATSDARRRVLAVLAEGELEKGELRRRSGASAAVLRALLKAGAVRSSIRREFAPDAAEPAAAQPAAALPAEEDAYSLTPGQAAALAAIESAREAAAFQVFLLFGVPGSGKTEVYVRAMQRAIADGRQALLLIPEIALTTQIVQRLARRFARVAVLHSRLSDAQRRATLASVAAGGIDVVIGTRAAVFAPLPRPGLIVVDEEQEGSYKNLSTPFYHARDAAIKRGQIENVPVLLGSGTPALETWHNAQHLPHYSLLRLPERVPGARLPSTRLAPVEREQELTGRVLTPLLVQELRDGQARGEQAVLLHNRRGYAAVLRCGRCGLVPSCERCGAHLVYHQTDRSARCHRCGSRRDAPERCVDSTCGGELSRIGPAIQRLEEELGRCVPNARLLRLDSDTMRSRADYESALQRFEAGEADVLLGTQMVAKGLDFPNVRLVGVIDADAALALPDFRAGERVFQLVVQTIGRAGRRAGESLAVVQSRMPPPPLMAAALRLDYEEFATRELEIRRRLFYPPFSRLVRIVLADARPGRAQQESERLADALTRLAARVHAELRVSPAQPCIAARLREMFRHEVLARGPRAIGVGPLLAAAASEKLLSPRVQRVTIDVDPVDLM